MGLEWLTRHVKLKLWGVRDIVEYRCRITVIQVVEMWMYIIHVCVCIKFYVCIDYLHLYFDSMA